MIRKRLFKAVAMDSYQWVFGDLISIPNENYYAIMPQRKTAAVIKVYSETVCEYIGIEDKNAMPIFEDDILRFPATNEWEEENYATYEVFYNDGNNCDGHIGYQFRIHFYGNSYGLDTGLVQCKPTYTQNMEIIGNIYDKKTDFREYLN